MTTQEKTFTKCLISEHISGEAPSDESGLSLAERAFKKRRMGSSKYMDCRLYLPTSNVAERIFSTAGLALMPNRKSVFALNFEKKIVPEL